MHYFQHNIADYRKDTAHLSLLEHGVYRQLLDQYYLSEQPIPLDENKLMRIICARSEDEKQAVRNVLQDFFIKTDDGFIHKRCDVEIEVYQSRVEVASRAGKASAIKRVGNDRSISVEHKSNDRSTTVQLTNNHKPITNNLITNINTIGDFELFWSIYPKKVGKDAARKAWIKINPDILEIERALTWQKQSNQWFEKGGQFIPNPSTYLNQGRWKDEPPEQVTY